MSEAIASNDWLFIGSSLNAKEQYAYAKTVSHKHAILITTNDGIYIEPDPDFYFTSGYEWSLKAPFDRAKQRRRRNGHRTKIVTWDHRESVVPDADIYIHQGKTNWHPNEPLPKTDYHCLQHSGQICMHFACINDASRVILSGCEGYVWGELDYFSKTLQHYKKEKRKTANQNIVVPQQTKICRTWPDVEFICVGQPTYEIEADNWTVIPLPGCSSDPAPELSSN